MRKYQSQQPQKGLLCPINLKEKPILDMDAGMDRDSLLRMASILAEKSVEKHKDILKEMDLSLN